MGTFLQILLAVVLVIAVIILFGFLWLKSKIGKVAGDVEVALRLIPSEYMEPARLHYYRSDVEECSPELDELAGQFRRLGFKRIADLAEYDSGCSMLRAMRHRERPIAATITEKEDGGVFFNLFTVTEDRFVYGRGNGQGKSMQNSRLDWRLSPDYSIESALQEIQSHASDNNLDIHLRVIQSVLEQLHAFRIDQFIVNPPTRESVERHALNVDADTTEEQIDRTFEFALDYWKQQINESVLDRYRRTSKVDAVTWEQMRDEVLVVHDHLSADDIESFLIFDEAGERLFEQLTSQDLKGVELFNATQERLPRDAQWTKVAEVERPIHAQLFSHNEAIESDERMSHQYIYEAIDDNGQKTAGAVYASSSADAKKQTQALGLNNAKLLVSPAPGNGNLDQIVFDDHAAEIAARSTREGLGKTLIRIVFANWWIWAPPTFLLWRTLTDGAPYGWADYAVFGYSVLAALAMSFFLGPSFFYNSLLQARLMNRPKRARIFLSLLRRMGAANGMTQSQLLCEQCKILAMEGRLSEATSELEKKRLEIGEEEFQTSLAQVYDTAGRWPEMIEAQRAVLAESPIVTTASLDLAMSIARFSDDAAEADAIVQNVSRDELSEIEVIGFDYVVGLLAARRGDYNSALLHYANANETAQQFASLPIMHGLIAEINGYAAIALKRCGLQDKAQSVWEKVWPILGRHHSGKLLLASYEAS